MNYSELIQKFWQYNEKDSLGATAIAFYFLLLDKYIANNSGNFTISDIELSQELKLSRNTIKATKDKLRNLGLIHYQSKTGVPCFYKIITDYSTPEIVKKPVKYFPPPITEEEKPIKNSVAEPKKDIIHSPKEPINNPNIPSIEEFLEFAKTLKNYSPELNSKIEGKYDSWIENNWRNGYDRPITNWRSTLKSTLPYLIQAPKGNMNPKEIPTINRPKSTYNE